MSAQTVVTEVEDALRRWAQGVVQQLSTNGIFLFGSLIYKNGIQFNPLISDIDLVICIPSDLTTAPERVEWINRLHPLKRQLEMQLLQLLKRADASSPISSVVAATATEIRGDIHKDGVARFFSGNNFRDLLNKIAPDGPAPNSGTLAITDDYVRKAMQFAQKYRNVFLGTSPNGTEGLKQWSGPDPVPKDVVRHAAMTAATGPGQHTPGAAFDVKIGLDYLTNHLYERRDRSQYYYKLHDWVSGRRGGRGAEEELEHLQPEMYLLLAEVICDLGTDALANASMVNGAENAHAPNTTASDALPATFTVSEDYSLLGPIDELKATLEEATHNLKWRLEPAFRLRFSEEPDAKARSNPAAEATPSERRRLAQRRDKALRLKQVAPTLEHGIRLILFYQNLLFPKHAARQKHLIIALNSFLRRVERTPYYSIGGLYEAYVSFDEGRFVVGFSMDGKARDRLLRACGFTDIMQLAADNQPLLKVTPDALARYFVPELVFDYVAKTKHGVLTSTQDISAIFDLSHWDVGIH
jgi:hypothetical protein